MARTRTPGITVDFNGDVAINKEVRGKRLFVRLGQMSQEDAEARLQKELERLDVELERSTHAYQRVDQPAWVANAVMRAAIRAIGSIRRARRT